MRITVDGDAARKIFAELLLVEAEVRAGPGTHHCQRAVDASRT
jgi:hypothetical protein